ncbi:centrosomal protein of 290 kDa-like [Dermacentor silvarum]|uniref:centrosomal protein of 290 kDa-like n=1 Tax=Dermacentor silvarum TaxID=543639 RepID=UPI002100E113|nr:centrosomal protein of 290 kDa-like [Dermacentor silvarum]
MIVHKEQELAEQRERLSTMEDNFAQIRLDTDHSTVSLLRKALEERDRQVKQLSQSLEQATRDLEDQSTIIEALQMERRQRDEDSQDGRPTARRGGRWLDLQGKLREKSLLLRSVQSMLGKVEEEARLKDKQLAEAVAAARKYELGEYGLSDAVAEIRDLKRQLEIRDREIEKLTSQLNDIEMEVQEECDNDRSTSPRHHFRPTRGELEEKIQRLERENRRQRLRLAAQRSIMRSASEVEKKHLDNFAQTSPLRDSSTEKIQVHHNGREPRGDLPDMKSVSSLRELARSPTIINEDSESLKEETSMKDDKCTPELPEKTQLTKHVEWKGDETPPLEGHEYNPAAYPQVAEPQVLLVNGKGASLVRLYEETVRAAKAWRADALRWKEGRHSGDEEQLASIEEKGSARVQLDRQASLDRLKDRIILEQLGHLEAFQHSNGEFHWENRSSARRSAESGSSAVRTGTLNPPVECVVHPESRRRLDMRIKCLQRRLEESVPKEAFKSLSDAYSEMAASKARLISRLADAGIADNKLSEEVCLSTEKGVFYLPATDDSKLRVLEEENEQLRALLADRTGHVQVLQGELKRFKHMREAKSKEPSSSPSTNEHAESLKVLLERLWTHFQELQKRYEQKDGDLLRAMVESRRQSEEQKQALTQMRIQCSGSVPLEKLESILSQFKSGLQNVQEEQDLPSCKNCSALTNTLRAQTEELITSRQNAKLLQKRLDEEHRNLQISANSLRVKDTIIRELKQALSRAAAEDAMPWDKAKLKKSLRVAMLTVNSLQALMRQKEATIERYRACVATLRDEMQQQSQRLSAEAHVLRAKLLDTSAARQLPEEDDAIHDKPRHFQDKLDQLRALDEAHREAVRILLLEAAKAVPAPVVQTRPASSAERPGSPPSGVLKLESQPTGIPTADVRLDRDNRRQATKTSTMFRDTVISLQKVIEEKDLVIAQRETDIAALEGRLAELASQLEEAAKRKDLGSLVHTLKSQVDDKERQLKALSQALVELRAEMMRTVELNTVAASGGDDDNRDIAHLQSELRAAQERERFLEDELRLLREENEAVKENYRKAQEERHRAMRLHKAPSRRGT